MNKVILQLWQESNIDEGSLSDGCSLHISVEERNFYVSNIYRGRNSDVPDKYDRIVGDYIEVFVSDEIYNKLKTEMSMKIPESAFQNLLKFEELIYNKESI